jgi:RNA polymerase sigma factor (TIGR02999 family)
MAAHDGPVTELLDALRSGRTGAADALVPILYRELRAIAAAQMARERGGHTLTPTALVHEAWLRLVSGPQPAYRDRRHFLSIAAIAMRRVLVDHARGLLRDKRGGGIAAVTLPAELPAEDGDPARLLAIDAALQRLAQIDPAMARVVELRWFGGLTVEEAADVLGIAPRSVDRAWAAARAWLQREVVG